MDGLAHNPEEWGGTPPTRRQSLRRKTRVPVFSGPSPVIMRAHFGAPHTKTRGPRLACPEQSQQQQHNRRTPKKRRPFFFWLKEATSFFFLAQRGHRFFFWLKEATSCFFWLKEATVFFLAQRGHQFRVIRRVLLCPAPARRGRPSPSTGTQAGGGGGDTEGCASTNAWLSSFPAHCPPGSAAVVVGVGVGLGRMGGRCGTSPPPPPRQWCRGVNKKPREVPRWMGWPTIPRNGVARHPPGGRVCGGKRECLCSPAHPPS